MEKQSMHACKCFLDLPLCRWRADRERERVRERAYSPARVPVCTLRWHSKKKKRLKRLVRNAAVAAGNSADAALAPIVVKVF